MGLNIKNARVHELARRAAQVTGQSQTSAIEQALVLLLRAYDADPAVTDRNRRVQELVALGNALRDVGDPSTAAHGPGPLRIEELYDEQTGLPR